MRDKGLVKKKIPVRNRSFEEVLEDLEVFFQATGKRLPPGILSDTLVKIGVPRAKRIITQEIVEERERSQEPAVPTPRLDISIEEPEEILPERKDRMEPLKDERKSEKEPPRMEIRPGEITKITEKDMPDIEEALSTVEALSDSFMAAHQSASIVNSKPQITISISGTDEIEASDTSTASDPNLFEEESSVAIDDGEMEVPQIDVLTESVIIEEPVEESRRILQELDSKESIEEPAGVQDSSTLEEATAKKRTTPAHAVKPLVSAKAVILGEDGVGKHSLMEKAELRIEVDEGDQEQPYIRSGIIQLADYRVNLSVWSFDDAANSRIPRKEFYRDVDVIIIVYAVSDRWSFESIDFWLREAMIKNQDTSPVVIVGNKKDLREAGDPDPLEPAVRSDEGFKMAETLAKRLGTEDKLHPVAFIETSCLTGEGTRDVFKTASEFYTAML